MRLKPDEIFLVLGDLKMEAWKEELYHHGILGQRWGKRNGPPYPLGSGDHSAVEKKAGWQKSLERTSEQNQPKKKLVLTDRQKKAIKVGAAVAVTALAAYGAYRLGSIDKLGNLGLKYASSVDRILNKNRGAADFLNSIDDLQVSTGFNKNKDTISILKSTAKVNPNYSTGLPEYRNNCFSSVLADILNRSNNGKGLDVVARAASSEEIKRGGLSFSEILKPFSGSSVDDIIIPKRKLDPSMATIDSVRNEVANQIIQNSNKSSSYGIIKIRLQNDSRIGHYLKWELENGKVIFSDSLSGTTGADKYFNAIISGRISRALEFSKLDGLAVNPFEIMKLVGKP